MFDKLKAKKEAKKKQKEAEKLDREQEDRCMPVAKYILSKILEADLTLGEKTNEEYFNEYKPIVEDILGELLARDMKLSEVSYIKKLILEMVENVDALLIQSINSSINLSHRALWGCSENDKTFSMLDKVLKDYGKKLEAEKKD